MVHDDEVDLKASLLFFLLQLFVFAGGITKRVPVVSVIISKGQAKPPAAHGPYRPGHTPVMIIGQEPNGPKEGVNDEVGHQVGTESGPGFGYAPEAFISLLIRFHV